MIEVRILRRELIAPNCHSREIVAADSMVSLKGVDREKSAVFKELTQSFRTYELRGQVKKKTTLTSPLTKGEYMCIYVYFKNTKNLFIHIALIPLGDLLEMSQHFKMSPPFASSD